MVLAFISAGSGSRTSLNLLELLLPISIMSNESLIDFTIKIISVVYNKPLEQFGGKNASIISLQRL